MAHPLAQHPPSSLPFTSASRPSSFGFGFGSPSSSSAFGTHAGLAGVSGFGRGLNVGLLGPSTPAEKSIGTPRVAVPVLEPLRTSLKRSRRSPSPTPSTPPSPTSSINPSPRHTPSELPKSREKDDLTVGGLALKDGRGQKPEVRRDVKRIRRDGDLVFAASVETGQLMDVGVLLATLPPSTHLSILLGILRDNPSLTDTVLAQLPQPDLDQCLTELKRCADRTTRSSGLTTSNLHSTNTWGRAEKEVDEFCKTASTYLNFFTSPPSAFRPRPEAQTQQSLLLALTLHVYSMLRLLPASSDKGVAPGASLLDLANLVLTAWQSWLSRLSDDVNQRGVMYAHPAVNAWAEKLDQLASHQYALTSRTSSTASPTLRSSSPWFQSPPSQVGLHQPANHYFTESFRSAIVPIRDRFMAELGWLVGRQTPIPTYVGRPSVLQQTPCRSAGNIWGSAGRPAVSGPMSGEDDEL